MWGNDKQIEHRPVCGHFIFDSTFEPDGRRFGELVPLISNDFDCRGIILIEFG
jgi:hypothetical protein